MFDYGLTTIIFALPRGHKPHLLDELQHRQYDCFCIHSEAELLSKLSLQSNWLIIISCYFPTPCLRDLITRINSLPNLINKHVIVWGDINDSSTRAKLLASGADELLDDDTPVGTFMQHIHDLFNHKAK